MESKLDLEKRVRPIAELGCPAVRFDVCGRLIVERERYARLEEQFERTRRDNEKYREFFSILLREVGSQLILNIIPAIFKHNMLQVSEVKEVHCFQRMNMISFWVFLEEENWEAEDKIYEIFGELLFMFPDNDIQMKLLRLWGRKPEDLLPAGGVKILGE